MFWANFPVFTTFQDELEPRKSLKSFFLQPIYLGLENAWRLFKVLYVKPDNRSDKCRKSYKSA